MNSFERMRWALGEAKRHSRQARRDRLAGRAFLFLSTRECRRSWMLLARAFRAIHSAREVLP